MADPHIKSPMDIWDYVSVIIYRSGFVLTVPFMALLPWHTEIGFASTPFLLVATAMLASSVHLYLKSMRYIIQYAAWSALLLTLLGFPLIGLGASLVAIGGLCFKEYFCFRIPLLYLQPGIVAALWFCLLFDQMLYAKILAGIAALFLVIVSYKKWCMPLHFDIGDKSKYEV